ncbi:MAG TPA: hypothetical protein VN611_02010 [Patescibacteria group bacterium]|nr:hypothetical protein [Patescibacteria group bacterium]
MRKPLPVMLKYFFDFWAAAGIIMFFITGIRYFIWPGFIDHAGEITMTSVAWLLYEGHPLYTALDAAERYSLQHGPLVYLLLGAVLKLLGPGFHSAKVAELLCLLFTAGLSWYWFRRFLSGRLVFWLVGLELWILSKWYYLYLSRSDALMLLLVLVAVMGVTLARGRWSAVFSTAVPLGLLASCKIHEILWAFPVLALLWRREGSRTVAWTLGIMAAVTLAPFAVPNISLPHYWQWLQASTTHGISPAIAMGNFSMLMLLFAFPAVLSWGFIRRPGQFWRKAENRQLIATMLAAALPIALVGSKAGSGSHHLAPLVPFLMYALLRVIQQMQTVCPEEEEDRTEKLVRRRRIGYAALVVLCLIVILGGINGQGRILKYREYFVMDRAMVAEFQVLKNEYRGQTMMIGYGENDRHKWYNQLIPSLVFEGNPYLLDIAALNDMGAAGMPIPAATLQALREGVTQVWLLPAGHKPFHVSNAYIDVPMFDETFRQTFAQYYQLTEQTRYFDVWVYRKVQE